MFIKTMNGISTMQLSLCLILFFGLISYGCNEEAEPAVDMMVVIDMMPDMEPRPKCGDGEINRPSEQCDDGNDNDQDACTNQCKLASCGDGIIHTGVESCDDGNQIAEDSCNACVPSFCGDGIVRADLPLFAEDFEECDDANDDDTDGCLSNCRVARCGDGIVQADVEECDDANSNNEDECLNSCILNTCGDGTLLRGIETCDDGNQNDEDHCRNSCVFNRCGDGVIEVGVEECDDGNDNDDQSKCTTECKRGRCGDGLILSNLDRLDPIYEYCDDGNLIETDACSNQCEYTYCGDGVVREGLNPSNRGYEECDPQDPDPAALPCDQECIEIRCGNGKVQADEECDGGELGNDYCDTECILIECGNGKQQAGEACDLGLTEIIPDLCRPDCSQPRCGDGIHDPRSGEECDEGINGGETCRPNCILRRCGDGIHDPSTGEACDDGDLDETDECLTNCQLSSCGDGVVRAGFEECDWGQDNSNEAADHCRTDCTLPSCGDAVTDFGEACDDGDADEYNGCNQSCEIAWCGNGEIDTFSLLSGLQIENCTLTSCITEECEPSLDGELCDDYCSFKSYSIVNYDQTERGRIAVDGEVDEVSFELLNPSFVHFVIRDSSQPYGQCRFSRSMTLSNVTDDEASDVQVLDPTSAFTDEGVCSLLQANLGTGHYQLTIDGNGTDMNRYNFRYYVSQDISEKGRFAIDYLSDEASQLAGPSLHHFMLTSDDLEDNSDLRNIRFVLHSSDIKEGESAESCPNLILKRDQNRQLIRDLEQASTLTPIGLQVIEGLRDQKSCAYEAALSEGLYHLHVPLLNNPFTAITYQWPSLCGDGEIDVGEDCDVGQPQSRYQCSELCLIDPPETSSDGICDREEAAQGNASDCILTCDNTPQNTCEESWESGYIYDRIVHSRNDFKQYNFTLNEAQHLKASLRYCTETNLSLSIWDSSGQMIHSDSGGSRELCAQIDLDLSAGDYQLRVSAGTVENPSATISYLLEAIRFLSIDDRHLQSAQMPGGNLSGSEPMLRLFELNVPERNNFEFRIFDDDETLQCESLSTYQTTLYRLEEDGHLERQLTGELWSFEPDHSTGRYDSGTASYNEEVPCYYTALTLESGHYIISVNSPETQPFLIQALNPRLCGNGEVDQGEECDDGNVLNGDGCTKYCIKEPICGDGTIDRGEECDDGNQIDGDLTCSSQCTFCGDGILADGEQCDDANVLSGDGCDHLCSLEVSSVHQAFSHHQGKVLQAEYETRDSSPIIRTTNDTHDLYTIDLSTGGDSITSGLQAVLCTGLKRSISQDQVSVSPYDLLNQLQVKAKLLPLPSQNTPLAEAILGSEIIADELELIHSESDLTQLEVCTGEDPLLSSEPLLNLANQEQRQRWAEQDHVYCVSMKWNNPNLDGQYMLSIEAMESWPYFRDHPITYDLNLMTWRELWSSGDPSLGLSQGAIPSQGNRLFKLIRPSGSSTELMEVRSLQDKHFSCPLDTETALTMLTSDITMQSCEIASRLPLDSSCASTRVSLDSEGAYYFLLRSRDPNEGLEDFGLKVRSVNRCGDGVLDWGEECDDGNRNENDECSKVCTFTYLLCGNGNLDDGEQCDDGNQISGDGCSATCVGERDTQWLERALVSNYIPSVLASELHDQLRPLFTFITYPVFDKASGTDGVETPLSGSLKIVLDPAEDYSILHKLCESGQEQLCTQSNGQASLGCYSETALDELNEMSPIAGEPDFKSCDLSLQLSTTGEETTPPYTLSYERSYPLSKSAQVYGRLSPFASDIFDIDLSLIAAQIPGTPPDSLILNAMITDVSLVDYLSSEEPTCAENMDSLLTLYDDQGQIVIENDDYSATNLCSAFFVILNLEAMGNTYRLKVQNLSLATSSYRLQITFPELCGNGVKEFGEECDPQIPNVNECNFCKTVEP